MKYLYRLTKEKYQEGAVACLDNANAHLDVASYCEQSGHFGMGISHLILAAEELCKASILRIKFLNPNLRISDLEKYFKFHEWKHEKVLSIFVSLSSMIKEKTPNKPKVAKEHNLLKNEVEVVGGILAFTLLLFIALLALSNKKGEKPQDNFEIMRQRGFYVGLSDEKTWELPSQLISREEFINASAFVSKMFGTINAHLFDKTPTKEDLAELTKELGYIEQKHTNPPQG